jgi:hypothetical protein
MLMSETPNYFTDPRWEEGLSGVDHGFFIKKPRWAEPSGVWNRGNT